MMLKPALRPPLRAPMRGATTLGKGGGDPLAPFDQLNGDWPGGDLAPRRNIWQYTEDLASNRYTVTSLTKQPETVSVLVNGAPVVLTRASFSSFYARIYSQPAGLGLTPFVLGHQYLVSCFIYCPDVIETLFWTRQLADTSTPGHGSRFLTNRYRRVWFLAKATSTTALDVGAGAAVALGSGAGDNPTWFIRGGGFYVPTQIYIGGFQIEDIADTAYKDGIALIGDSTIQGGAGTNDFQTAAGAISHWLEGLLNTTAFNRAVSGQRTDEMAARWATDMTPLAVRSKYAFIQGGVNDFGQSRALVDVQASFSTMIGNAVTDGVTPVVCTCTPSFDITGANNANRLAFNDWIRANNSKVLDLARLVDPSDSGAWPANLSSDGKHPNVLGRRTVGVYAAGLSFWSFKRPTPYQKVTAATYP